MMTYAAVTIAMHPAASPSSPSVKLTAFDHDMTRTTQNSTKSAGANVTVAISRTYDSCAPAGVIPSALGNCSTRMPKRTAATTCPTALAVLFSPRLRAFRILIRSSTNPTAPSAVPAACAGFVHPGVAAFADLDQVAADPAGPERRRQPEHEQPRDGRTL